MKQSMAAILALNGFPIFAPLKATTRHIAKQESRDRAPSSKVVNPCCVVESFARHHRIRQCRNLPVLKNVDAISACHSAIKLVAGAGFEPAIPPLRRDYEPEERRT